MRSPSDGALDVADDADEPPMIMELADLPPEMLDSILERLPPCSLAVATRACTALQQSAHRVVVGLGHPGVSVSSFIHAMHLLEQPLIRLDAQPKQSADLASKTFGRARTFEASACVRIQPGGPPRRLIAEESAVWPCENARLIVRFPPSVSGSWYEAKQCVFDGDSLTSMFCDGDVETALSPHDVAIAASRPVTLIDLLHDCVDGKCRVLVCHDSVAPMSRNTYNQFGSRWNPAHVTGVTLASARADPTSSQDLGSRCVDRDGQMANRVADELSNSRRVFLSQASTAGADGAKRPPALFRTYVKALETAHDVGVGLAVVTSASDMEQQVESQRRLQHRREREEQQRRDDMLGVDFVYR